MRRVQMLEQRATWMRKNGFDGTDIIAERHEETLTHLHADLDPEPCYTGICNPRRPLTRGEINLDLKVEVESLSMELLLL